MRPKTKVDRRAVAVGWPAARKRLTAKNGKWFSPQPTKPVRVLAARVSQPGFQFLQWIFLTRPLGEPPLKILLGLAVPNPSPYGAKSHG